MEEEGKYQAKERGVREGRGVFSTNSYVKLIRVSRRNWVKKCCLFLLRIPMLIYSIKILRREVR